MDLRFRAFPIIVGIAAATGVAAAATPTADEIVRRAVAAAETSSTMDAHDMMRAAVHQEETLSDGTTENRDLTAVFHGGRIENVRVELSGGISLVLNNTTGWAMIRGQLDTRPQTPRMAAGTIRQTMFPLLLPFSMRMAGVQLGAVTEGSFDGTPAWIVEATFDAGFFAAPSMVTTWSIFIGREDNLVLGAEYLPPADYHSVRDEGIRYRYLKRQDVDGINLPAQVLLDGIDLNGAETGHVRVTKIDATTVGPLDLTLFINPEESERLDAGEIE